VNQRAWGWMLGSESTCGATRARGRGGGWEEGWAGGERGRERLIPPRAPTPPASGGRRRQRQLASNRRSTATRMRARAQQDNATPGSLDEVSERPRETSTTLNPKP